MFAEVRLAREAFVGNSNATHVELNYGAPRAPRLEFDNEFSATVQEYLSSLFDSSTPTFAKFTRLYSKIFAFQNIVPDAVFVALVRSPWSMVNSYLAGYGGRNQLWLDRIGVLNYRPFSLPWSADTLGILAAEACGLGDRWWRLSGAQRVLVLWRYVYERTLTDGISAYGERFLVLKHEDFVRAPLKHSQLIYDMAGLPLSDPMRAWVASGNIRLSERSSRPVPKRWKSVLESVGADGLASRLGYL